MHGLDELCNSFVHSYLNYEESHILCQQNGRKPHNEGVKLPNSYVGCFLLCIMCAVIKVL